MTQLVVTCEHGGHQVPAAYRALFRKASDVLATHRGWDPGALSIANTFQQRLRVPLFSNTITRLLVELNRSAGHRQLFSEFTRGLDAKTKQSILRKHYYPYRDRIETWIADQLRTGESALHVSCHTFTPEFDGHIRNADIGLLYDPKRDREKRFCQQWRDNILCRCPGLRVRRNYPYLGSADGFTTYLRHKFPPMQYVGIELEVNQRWIERAEFGQLKRILADSLSAAYDEWRDKQ